MLLSAALCQYDTPGGGWSDLERLAADPDYVYEVQFAPAYPVLPRACYGGVQMGYYLPLTLTVPVALLTAETSASLCVLMVTAHITLLAS